MYWLKVSHVHLAIRPFSFEILGPLITKIMAHKASIRLANLKCVSNVTSFLYISLAAGAIGKERSERKVVILI